MRLSRTLGLTRPLRWVLDFAEERLSGILSKEGLLDQIEFVDETPTVDSRRVPEILAASISIENHSWTSFNVLALRASHGEFNVDELLDFARTSDESERRLHRWDFPSFGKLLLGFARSPQHRVELELIVDLAIDAARDVGVNYHVGRLCDILLELGRWREVAALLPQVPLYHPSRRNFERDLARHRAKASGRKRHHRHWLRLVNRSYRHGRVQSVAVANGAKGSFADLVAEPVTIIEHGDLVTVIMVTFQPGENTFTSLRSILNQSWENLEIIVVEDFGGEEYDGAFATMASLDDRVVVIRNSDNTGPYVRRNQALRQARGVFVTFQDDDDWSHPRRVELQVLHLRSRPHLMANCAPMVRVTHDLFFSHERGGHVRAYSASPTLLYRREPVTREIGYFDSVRKGADAEFSLRLKRAFGVAIPSVRVKRGSLIFEAPLIWMLHRSDSLSGSDYPRGYEAPPRMSYKNSYAAWHRDQSRRGERLFVPDHQDSRLFPAPHTHLGASSNAGSWDIVVVMDSRSDVLPDGFVWRWLNSIAEFREQGKSVALVHVPSPRKPRNRKDEFHHAIGHAILTGHVTELNVRQEFAATRLIIASCASALGLPIGPTGISAEVVEIAADTNFGVDITGVTFTTELVEQSVTQFLRSPPNDLTWSAN